MDIRYRFKKKNKLERAIIWITHSNNFKKVLDLDGSKPESAIRSGFTGQRILVLKAMN